MERPGTPEPPESIEVPEIEHHNRHWHVICARVAREAGVKYLGAAMNEKPKPVFELPGPDPDGGFTVDRGHDLPVFGEDGHILTPEEREKLPPVVGPLVKPA